MSVSSRRDFRSAACAWRSKQRTTYPTWQLAQCQQQLGRRTWGRLPPLDDDACQSMLTQQLNPPFSKENAEVPVPARPAGIKSGLTLLRSAHWETQRAGSLHQTNMAGISSSGQQRDMLLHEWCGQRQDDGRQALHGPLTRDRHWTWGSLRQPCSLKAHPDTEAWLCA